MCFQTPLFLLFFWGASDTNVSPFVIPQVPETLHFLIAFFFLLLRVISIDMSSNFLLFPLSSPFCYWIHSVRVFFFQLLYFSVPNFHLLLICFCFFAESLYFNTCIQTVCNFLFKHFIAAALKFLPGNLNVCNHINVPFVFPMWVEIFVFFLCQVTLVSILGILGIMS